MSLFEKKKLRHHDGIGNGSVCQKALRVRIVQRSSSFLFLIHRSLCRSRWHEGVPHGVCNLNSMAIDDDSDGKR